jgi:hypothetical protein
MEAQGIPNIIQISCSEICWLVMAAMYQNFEGLVLLTLSQVMENSG